MTKITKLMVNLVALGFLYSCSTTQVSESVAASVPSDRVYQTSFLSSDKDPARLTFVRDKGLSGAACKIDLYVNGQRAFSIGPSEKATIDVSPGEHLLRSESGVGSMCPNEYETKEIVVKAGERRNYRFSVSGNFNIGFTREM